MNKLIRELMIQAVSNVDNLSGDPDSDIHRMYIPNIFAERFAKLIVRECADICNKIYFDRYPDAEDFERSEEGDAIKQHFGVE